MKHIILTIIIALASITASAESELFQKCEDIPGVSTVYVSTAMLKNAGIDKYDFKKANLSGLVSKVESLEVISAEGSSMAQVAKLADTLIKSSDCESLVRVKEDNEIVNIFLRKLPKGRSELVIYTKENNEITLVILCGTITMEDAINATKKNTRR